MTDWLPILAGIVIGLVVIVSIIRVSAWITTNKSSSALMKRRSDASNINGGGFKF